MEDFATPDGKTPLCCSVVRPERPWQTLRLEVEQSGVRLATRGGKVILAYTWDDISDVYVDGVAGFWGLRMAVVVTLNTGKSLRLLAPRRSLFLYPHDRAIDLAASLREYQAQANLHLV